MNRKLKNTEDFSEIQIQVPGNTPYKKYGTAPLVPKADVSLCTECKVCVKACPAGAISLEDPKKTDKKKCISCMKCVYSCKQKARYVSKMKMNAIQKKLAKGAISLEDPKKTDKKKCISCMKCVYSCKQKARYVSKMKMNAIQKKLAKVCKSDKEAEFFV